MTLANFKTMVASYVNRPDLTSVNGQDLILLALNDARRQAQRDHMFELNRTEDCFLSTSARGANWMTGCKTTPGGATAIEMVRIDEVWNFATQTVAGGTAYLRTWPTIPFDYSGRFKRDLNWQGYPTNQVVVTGANQAVLNDAKFAYCVGTQLYVTTVMAATNFKLVGIKLLSDLADGDAPDIFLTYYSDWLKVATVQALNFYLKDGERFGIDMNELTRLWTSVKQHDGTIANMGESANLD